jgi:hypothetical protein
MGKSQSKQATQITETACSQEREQQPVVHHPPSHHTQQESLAQPSQWLTPRQRQQASLQHRQQLRTGDRGPGPCPGVSILDFLTRTGVA